MLILSQTANHLPTSPQGRWADGPVTVDSETISLVADGPVTVDSKTILSVADGPAMVDSETNGSSLAGSEDEEEQWRHWFRVLLAKGWIFTVLKSS